MTPWRAASWRSCRLRWSASWSPAESAPTIPRAPRSTRLDRRRRRSWSSGACCGASCCRRKAVRSLIGIPGPAMCWASQCWSAARSMWGCRRSSRRACSGSARTLTAAGRRDPRVSWAIAEFVTRRLYENLEQTAVNAFGSVRQRVAAHLLDLASTRQEPAGRLAARISQQELADAAGTVREVVARVLRELRTAGIIATATDHIVILDATRLYAESAGSARA